MADVNLLEDLNADDGMHVKETEGGSRRVLEFANSRVGIGVTTPFLYIDIGGKGENLKI